MTIFIINIGNLEYAKYSIPLISKIADYNKAKIFILDKNISQNTNSVHPSWLKLFCHDLVNDEYIICWDADLVPTQIYRLEDFFRFEQINLAYDSSYVKENFRFNGKFKYNCGLIGIPKKESKFFKEIYAKSLKSDYPSFEQYHVNDKIYDTKKEINILDIKLNKMYDGQVYPDSYNMHYTWKITSPCHKNSLIQDHYNNFLPNFLTYK